MSVLGAFVDLALSTKLGAGPPPGSRRGAP